MSKRKKPVFNLLMPAEVELEGLKFVIRPETSDWKSIAEVVGQRAYERQYFKVEEGETWLDLGTYVGAFSVWAASKGAKVIAFEPDKSAYEMAQQNIMFNELSDRVELLNVAVDLEAGIKPFYVNSMNGNLWRNSLIHKWGGGTETQITAVDWRAWLKDGICIKMDIEGSEVPLLENLPEDVKIKKMVFEYSFDIWPSIAKYNEIIEKLKTRFRVVKYKKIKPEVTEWPQSWQPANAMIFCYN